MSPAPCLLKGTLMPDMRRNSSQPIKAEVKHKRILVLADHASTRGARGYCVSTIGLDEEKIRKYLQWQEKQAQAVQGKLFD